MIRNPSKILRSALILSAMVSLGACSVIGGITGGKGKPKTPTLGERIPILTSESAVEVDPALTDVAVLLPAAQINDAWGQPGGNAAKSMEHLAVGQALGAAWSVSIPGSSKQVRLAAAPVVAGGRVYVMDTQANVHAIDAKSGGKIWTIDFGTSGKNKGSVFGGGVSVEEDKLYVTNGLGDVAALNASNGSVIWKKRPGSPLRGAPTIANGNIYVMSSDNQIYALKSADGNVEWASSGATELAGVFGVGAPAVAQGTVIAGFSSGELNAYRYENGRALWGDALSRTSITTSVSALADVDADPVIDRGRVFAVGKGGRMVSLELVTGQRLWEINVAGISTPWIAGEWLFVVTDDARLLCIARATGKVRWVSQLPRYQKVKKKAGQITWTGPVLAGDRLILASSEGQLANISPTDGKLQSVTKAGGAVFLPPVVAGNTLYILDNNGRLTAWR
jgi:outer membrane protein assembly factor BamB